MSKLNNLDIVAQEMVDIYKDYSRTVTVAAPDGTSATESLVNDEGMSKLADAFNDVAIGNRGNVFSSFLSKLSEQVQGVNIEQFQAT